MRSKANITDADLARVQEAPLVPHLGHAEDADHDSERGHRSGTEQHTAATGVGEAHAALDMAAANSGYLIGIGVRPKHVSRALLGQPE